jgi:uncharacterized membrane protein
MATWIERQLRRLRRRGQWESAPLLGTLGVGAGLMYLLDPDRGTRRRALVRDRIVHTLHALSGIVERGARDLSHRAHGFVVESQSFFRDEEVPDEVLTARVRSKLGHVVGHPHAIDVAVHRGRVELRGPVLSHDVEKLLSSIALIPGVRGLDSHLEGHAAPDHIAALQGLDTLDEERLARKRERWSPFLRLLAGAAGVGLLLAGLRRRDRLGALLRLGGIAILVRDVANQSLRRLLGFGAGRNVIEIHKTFTIQAAVDDVFELWLSFESFPLFMDHLRRVEPMGEGRYHWVASGPAGLSVSWEADIIELVPGRRIAWASLPGAVLANEGVVQFDENPDGSTRVTIKLAYNPPGGVLGHLLAALFGADPKHAMDEDLVRFQSLIERGKTTAHGHIVRFAEIAGKKDSN